MRDNPFGADALLTTFQQALKTVLEFVQPISRTESIHLENAGGRVLASDVIASHSTPPFRRASMDGYAVIAADTIGASSESAVTLRVLETVYAGSVGLKEVTSGYCTKVATGAPMPEGADSMVIVEHAVVHNASEVDVLRTVIPGENVAPEGEDIRRGEVLLSRDSYLSAGKVGAFASQGLERLMVYARPKVAILSTGEEIASPGADLKPGQIYDINSYTLATVAQSNGGEVIRLAFSGDDVSSLSAKLSEALQADIIVTSGGSSVGDRDLLLDALLMRGEVLFHGIKVKPGKPTLFAMLEGKPVLGMPGYPASCLLNAYLLLLPAIRRLARLPPLRPACLHAKMGECVHNYSDRLRFLPVAMQNGKVYSVFKESGAITSLSRAEGYIAIPENVRVPEGDEVEVVLFEH